MTHGEQELAAGPKWLPWAFLGLLVLPFHPLWIDFEQVRRGLLLALAGAALCALPRLPSPPGNGAGTLFIGALVLSGVWTWCAQQSEQDADAPASFAAWEATYRIAHWYALLVTMRLGALSGAASATAPAATLLLATSAFGLLQHLGVAEVAGYGVAREPVTTLGNLNVAAEWTAVATAATVALLPLCTRRGRWLAGIALVFAGAYLMVNPSRSGKVAAACALAALALVHLRDRRKLKVAACGALALAVGALLGLAAAAASPARQQEELNTAWSAQRNTATLQVRFEIADSVGDLLREAPLLGHGPGMFQVEYPRHRNQEEIETSSFGRRFPAEVRHAHNDWLELLIDGGAVALLLFLWTLSRIAGKRRTRELLLPLFALVMMMFVRAPALNAPAAALAFWLAGADVQRQQLKPRGYGGRLFTVVAGAALLLLGTLPVAANSVATGYLNARRIGEEPPLDGVVAAGKWMPSEPRWQQLQAYHALNAGDLQKAAHLAAKAVQLRPYSPPLLLLLSEVLARGSRYGEAIQVARRGLTQDPANPELRALVSVALAELGDVERAILEVVEAPHPVLRAGLAQHFFELAERAEQRGEREQVSRYLIEQMFIAIADNSGSTDEETLQMIGFLQLNMQKELERCGRSSTDLRWLYSGALAALDADSRELANSYGEAAASKGARLERWQKELLGDQLDRLRALSAWRRLLNE